MKQIQYITTKALISDKKKIFMVQDQAGNWELPGGKIEFGETPEEALKREVTEEISIPEITIKGLVNIFSFISADPILDGIDRVHFIVLVYSCDADLSAAKLSSEHQNSAWVPFENLLKYKMKDGYRETFRKFENSLKLDS